MSHYCRSPDAPYAVQHAGMKALVLLAALMLAAIATAPAAEKDARIFEMRTYYAAPGKLDDLHKRDRKSVV